MNTRIGIQMACAPAALALVLTCAGCGNNASTSNSAQTTAATTTVAATRAQPPAAVTEEQKDPVTEVSPSAQTGNTIDAGTFTVEIPEYWQGRVSVSATDGSVKIYPNELPNCPLIEIDQMSEPTEFSGDVVNSRLATVQLGSNGYAEPWIKRWAYIATMPESEIARELNSNDPNVIAGLDILVDLQTGGAMKYADLASSGTTGQVDINQADAFLTSELVPTIKAK